MKHFGHSFCSMYKDQRGFVLVMTLILAAMISAMAATYTLAVRTDTVLRGAAGRERHGFYAAEAGLNVGMAEFATIFKTYGVPTSSDYTARTISVGNRTVSYQLAPVVSVGSCTDTLQADCYVTIPAGEKFAGLKSIPYRYTAQATGINAEGDEEAVLGAEFDVHNIPIFQFLAFSTDDLFIMPAPTMDLHGRIHTNGDLYLNVNSGKTLSVGDDPDTGIDFIQVSGANNIYRGGYKSYTGQICTGTVNIDKLEDVVSPMGNFDPKTLSCVGNGSSPVPSATLDSYLGSLEAGIQVIEMPSMDDLARGSSGVYWQNADLRIVLRLDQARQEVNFGAAGLCPNGPVIANTEHPKDGTRRSQALFPIQVQDQFGNQDVARTTALHQFMCQRRGAIFYTDRPDLPHPAVGDTTYSNTNNNYTPSFPTVQEVGGPLPWNDRDTIYRRVGEDTNGDGLVNNGDRNDDICPIADNPPQPVPPWRPSYCDDVYGPWPNATVNHRGTYPALGGAPGAGPLNASSWYLDYDYRRGGFYSHREEEWLYMLNVNVRALIDWNEANGAPLFDPGDRSDWGLVFFLSVQGPESTQAQNGYATRIFDSADLNTGGGTFPWPAPSDPSGLTVISDQAVYVQGNYNSIHKYPAAVFGDAVNVLSQGWEVPLDPGNDPHDNDRKSAADLDTNLRDVPTQNRYLLNLYNPGGGHNTTCPPNGCTSFTGNTALQVNTAFITGIGSQGVGVYNGGLENFMRFHESWAGFRLNYLGSFVALGLPAHQRNDWPCGSGEDCNVYDPPDRFWDFDPDFALVENLPPLTPMITYVQQRLYTRFYE